jgi:hypothetical protein
MSWLDNVDWAKTLEQTQRIEMLRLQQEQADEMRKQTELLKAAVEPPRTYVSAPQQAQEFPEYMRDPNFIFVNAINSYIFSYLIPTKNWREIEVLVQIAVSKHVFQQTTNAISNGAIALYLEGRMQDAIAAFNLALNRPDKFAEAEASWFLARIYSEAKDSKKSKEFAKRCDAAGGYQAPEFLA